MLPLTFSIHFSSFRLPRFSTTKARRRYKGLEGIGQACMVYLLPLTFIIPRSAFFNHQGTKELGKFK
jgi:hypothetical protein